MKSPAFQFYAAEFLADENVVLMTNQEVGCYIKLMAYCCKAICQFSSSEASFSVTQK